MRSSLFLLLLLSGCVVGPNYHRPDLDIPESYTFEPDITAYTLDTSWWEHFNDPVLTDLIEQAACQNYDILAAAARVNQAIGFLTQIRSGLFPQTGYFADYSRTRVSESGFTGLPFSLGIKNPYNEFDIGFAGSWDLDLFGRIKRETEAACAGVYGANEAKKAVVLSVVSLTAKAYITLLGLDAQLEIATQTLEAYQEEVTYFENQFKYGQASQMAVVQAKTQYEIAASTIPQVELDIINAEHALSVLLGINPSRIPRGSKIEDLESPLIPAGIPSEILCQRPDVLAAEYNLIAKNALIGAAQALYYPNISLTGAFGQTSQELSNLFTGPAKAWNYTGSLTGPLFTFGNIYGQVEQAKAAAEEALWLYKNSVITAFRDVEDALAAHDYLKKKFDAQEKLVAASGEYVHLAQLQFKGGYSPYFVVLQAQEQYFPAQLSWVQTRVELLNSVISTYQAMGGGWIDCLDYH